LAEFGAMLKVEYPDVDYLEIQLGLVKTEFNRNRYRQDLNRFTDIYQQPHLTVCQAADIIVPAMFNSSIKVAP
jgi:hypothetical protein